MWERRQARAPPHPRPGRWECPACGALARNPERLARRAQGLLAVRRPRAGRPPLARRTVRPGPWKPVEPPLKMRCRHLEPVIHRSKPGEGPPGVVRLTRTRVTTERLQSAAAAQVWLLARVRRRFRHPRSSRLRQVAVWTCRETPWAVLGPSPGPVVRRQRFGAVRRLQGSAGLDRSSRATWRKPGPRIGMARPLVKGDRPEQRDRGRYPAGRDPAASRARPRSPTGRMGPPLVPRTLLRASEPEQASPKQLPTRLMVEALWGSCLMRAPASQRKLRVEIRERSARRAVSAPG